MNTPLWTPDDEPWMMRFRRLAAIIGVEARVRDVAMVCELLGLGPEPTEKQLFDAVMGLWADRKKIVIVEDGQPRTMKHKRFAEIQRMDLAAH